MRNVFKIMNGIKKLLLLRGTLPNNSVLSQKIKISGKQENRYKKETNSVLCIKTR